MRVVVVGAGCMGSATAFHLSEADSTLQITVYDRDLSLRRSSTLLSDGNVRVQFNLEENVAMSLYAFEVLSEFGQTMAVDHHRPDISRRGHGNLFLVDSEGEAQARAGLELQQRMGGQVEWLAMDKVRSRFPELDSPRLIGGTFGSGDGPVDPGAVTRGYQRAAADRGVEFEEGEISGLITSEGCVGGVGLGDGSVVEADVVVVCAGAWSTQLLATAGVEIPVDPVMRTVYVVASDVGHDLPSFFLPAGLYVLPESAGRYLMAWSRPDDPIGFDFTPADRTRFYEVLWPELFGYLPAFDRLEVVGSWAGLYEQNRLDHNAILGEWPHLSGLYQATGFSGHGFQQCHAVGRYLGELICEHPISLDLSRLGCDRILAARPLREYAGRII